MRRSATILGSLFFLSSAQAATVNVEVLQTDLEHPWSLAFLPDNDGVLITLRGVGPVHLLSPCARRAGSSTHRRFCPYWANR